VKELVKNVSAAAFDLSPRMLIDPRVGLRYMATLNSQLLKLQGRLFLAPMLTTPSASDQPAPAERALRSIA
jgi:hypothetical protein